MLAWSWAVMVALALGYGVLTGQADAVTKGALDGAASAVELCLAMAGVLCLWSGVMAVMKASGLAVGLSRLMTPLLGWLFPSARRDGEAMEAISANVSANMLGLGNAATPAGVRAARRLQVIHGGGKLACNDLCTFLVLNTASIQLIPATVGGVRASLGAAQPFDILPAVWLTSLSALAVGLLLIKTMQRFGRRRS